MIDEAQDLRPQVLEQVRLLTNLETPKHKLLQIFLIGQPELRTLLRREGLRQLNQRITARYHLRPFNAVETAEYIRHRLAVAGVERQLFTRDAIRLVPRVSGGVPRLINILCDRSLLGACVTRNPLVTKSIVNQAAREVKDSAQKRYGSGLGRLAVIAAALVLAVAGGWMTRSWLAGVPVATSSVPAFLTRWLPSRQAELSTTPGATTPGTAPEQASGLAAAEPETAGPGADLILADLALDRAAAIRVLLRRWGVELADLGPGDPCMRVMDYGLRCEFDGGGWSRMRFFDRPAVIELVTEDLAERYLAIGALDAEAAILDLDEGRRWVSLTALDAAWDGDYLLLWQPPPVGGAIIGPGSRGESVRWLRKLLSQVPDAAFEAIGSGTFDPALDEAVRRFQKREGLEIDGIAGPKTLIRLHNAVGMPEISRLAPVF